MLRVDHSKSCGVLRRVFSGTEMGRIALETRFARRKKRKLGALDMSCVLVAGLASGTADSVADLLRTFTDLTGRAMSYNPFYDRLNRACFPLPLISRRIPE